MGTGASLAANSAAESVAGVRSSVLLRAFKGTDFTEAPPDLRGQEDEGSGPQWALMSALIERHTRQLELRAQYTALEKELERRYDEQEAKDKEFLDALMSVGQSIQQAKSPKTDEGKAQRLVDEAEEEASLRALKLEMDRESHRERMQARLIARKKSQRIRAQRSKAMDRHRQRKMSMWQSVRHVSRSLQRGFHATHHHFGGAFQKLEGVDKEMFELRREQAELSQRHRAAKTAHAKALRRLRNDLAIAEQTLNSAKARETTARLKEKDAKNHRHAAFVAKKNVEAALEEQREASIQVAKAKFQVESEENTMREEEDTFLAAESGVAQRMVALMTAKAKTVEDKLAAASQWVEQSGSDGIVYYWNPARNISQWEKPSEVLLEEEVHKNRAWKQVVHAHLAAALVSRTGFHEDTTKGRHTTLNRFLSLRDDVTDETYYYDNLTGATSWDDPRVLDAVNGCGDASESGASESDDTAQFGLAERIRAVEGNIGDEDQWYYELTRSTLHRASEGSSNTDPGQQQLVRMEWVNLEEATIFQLELDIMNIESEIAQLEQGDTDGLLEMLEELDDESPSLDVLNELGEKQDSAMPDIPHTTSQVQRQLVEDFVKQEEAAELQVKAKAALEKEELQERIRQKKQHRAAAQDH